MYFIFDPTYDKDYYSNKTKDVPLILSETRDSGLLHELHKENTTLFTLKNQNWTRPAEGQVFFYAIMMNENNTYVISPKTTGYISIAPKMLKYKLI